MLALSKFVLGKRGIMPRSNVLLVLGQKNFFTGTPAANEYKTMGDLREEFVAKLSIDKTIKPVKKSVTTDQLPVKRMRDSLKYAVLPLSTDENLRERYSTFQGSVRIGRLLEDLDMFAAWCCIHHLMEPGEKKLNRILVTVLVDDIRIFKPFLQADVRISGHVCWAGRSTLDVVVWMEQEVNGKWERNMQALLLFAARNIADYSSSLVNPLVAETPEEEALLKEGEKRKLKRIKQAQESLLKKEPSESEFKLIHDLFLKTMDFKEVILDKRTLPPHSKWMHDATLSNLIFCHPEHRNVQNKIFGGFLMRQAVELSWTIAYIYGMQSPKLIHVSDITFHSPVDVGTLLHLYASVTYVEDRFIQVFVYAIAQTHSEGSRSTNSFSFTYDLDKPCDKIYPSTYLEAMKYIAGRRLLKALPETK